MNLGNASGFLLLGLVMWLLPSIAPTLFPQTGLDGSSARAMWIQVMAVVQGVLGITFLFHHGVLPWLVRWLAAEPELQPEWRQASVPEHALPIEGVAIDSAFSAQRALLAVDKLEADGVVTLRGKHAALWHALKEAFLDEERFMHFIERFRILARERKASYINGSAPVVFSHDAEHALVHLIQASGINLDLLERRSRNWLGKVTAGAFLREAADEVGQVMGDARRVA